MKTKRIIACMLAGAMTVMMAACGGDNTQNVASTGTAESENNSEGTGTSGVQTGEVKLPNTDAPNTQKTDEELVIELASEPSTLYGAATGTVQNEDCIIGNAIRDTLVRYDYGTNSAKPNLATDWEWTDDTHLKMTLRDDVTMTDGTPLTVDDVVYTVNKIWVELNQSNGTGQYVTGATADDEHTVTIEFNTTAPDFVAMLSWPNFGIVSEDEVNAAGGIDGIQKNPLAGSGRYKFKEWKNGQYIILERNENYWNPDYVGYYKTIKLVFTSDAAAREMAVESGDADFAYNMPVSQAAAFVGSETVNTAIYNFGQTTHLWYNMGENAGATKDIKVRQAIDKALNFDAIAQVGTAGFGQSALSYFDTSCAFYQANYTSEERTVDIEGAKQLLAEAGYENGLEITALGLQDIVPVLTVMQANLAEAGITLNLDTPDTAQFVEGAFGGNYDIICVGDMPNVRTPASVMPFLQEANVNGPGMVIGGPKWTSDEFNKEISALIVEADNQKSKEIAQTLDELVKENMVCSNLYPEMAASVYAKDLKGFNLTGMGFIEITEFYK